MKKCMRNIRTQCAMTLRQTMCTSKINIVNFDFMRTLTLSAQKQDANGKGPAIRRSILSVLSLRLVIQTFISPIQANMECVWKGAVN